ncbi:hypothetical protein [Streptomyces hygroscopicus]|nr:hypothetical protein [Streptomyces hygroscopicus]
MDITSQESETYSSGFRLVLTCSPRACCTSSSSASSASSACRIQR